MAWIKRNGSDATSPRTSQPRIYDEDGWMRFAENASKARGDAGGRSRPDQRLRWTGIGVLVLLVAGLSWFVWSYVHKKISLGMPSQLTRSVAATTIGVHSGNYSFAPGTETGFAWPDPPLIRS